MIKRIFFFALILILVSSCRDGEPLYPDEPEIEYRGFSFLVTEDQLGNLTLTGRLSFDFTDGDGNLGLYPLPDDGGAYLPDTVKYNFFLQLYDYRDNEFIKVPEDEGGWLMYRIPYLDKEPLSGTIDLDISYPIIVHDTIRYTFYIMDRDYHRSNTDTTETVILSNLDLENF